MATVFNGKSYDDRHGGPFDRGSADSWYSRVIEPHYYEHDTHESRRIEAEDMTPEQIADYLAGYEYNEINGGKKDYE